VVFIADGTKTDVVPAVFDNNGQSFRLFSLFSNSTPDAAFSISFSESLKASPVAPPLNKFLSHVRGQVLCVAEADTNGTTALCSSLIHGNL